MGSGTFIGFAGMRCPASGGGDWRGGSSPRFRCGQSAGDPGRILRRAVLDDDAEVAMLDDQPRGSPQARGE
ncbi:hypothetical protein ADK52_14240 [Streptomyces sp. WM6372]|nr:hypothetical protein ADK52_14240 [Streptomyces sp. WM6372]